MDSEKVPRPVHLPEADEDQKTDAGGHRLGREDEAGSIGPLIADASISRNAPSNGEPSSALIAAKLPVGDHRCSCSACRLPGLVVPPRPASPPPIAIKGASGPSTMPPARPTTAASATPGTADGRGGAWTDETGQRRVPAASRQVPDHGADDEAGQDERCGPPPGAPRSRARRAGRGRSTAASARRAPEPGTPPPRSARRAQRREPGAGRSALRSSAAGSAVGVVTGEVFRASRCPRHPLEANRSPASVMPAPPDAPTVGRPACTDLQDPEDA